MTVDRYMLICTQNRPNFSLLFRSFWMISLLTASPCLMHLVQSHCNRVEHFSRFENLFNFRINNNHQNNNESSSNSRNITNYYQQSMTPLYKLDTNESLLKNYNRYLIFYIWFIWIVIVILYAMIIKYVYIKALKASHSRACFDPILVVAAHNQNNDEEDQNSNKPSPLSPPPADNCFIVGNEKKSVCVVGFSRRDKQQLLNSRSAEDHVIHVSAFRRRVVKFYETKHWKVVKKFAFVSSKTTRSFLFFLQFDQFNFQFLIIK
jgi:hypothetical protein